MNCMKYDPYAVKCASSGSFGRRLWANRILWFLMGSLLWGSLGYAWHWAQVTDDHQERVARLNAQIANQEDKLADYRKNCLPIEGKKGKIK